MIRLPVQWAVPSGYASDMVWVSTGPDHQYEGEVVGFVPGKAIVRTDDRLVEVDLDDLTVRPTPPDQGEVAEIVGQSLYQGGYHDGFLDGYLQASGEDTYPDEEGEREISMRADSENIADGWQNHRDAFLSKLGGKS